MLLEILLAAQHCVAPRAPQLMGLWEFRPPATRDGMEHAIELRPDGTFREALTVMLDDRYRVSKDGLAVVWDETKDLTSAKATFFGVTSRTLRRARVGNEKDVRMTRMSPPGDRETPIVGEWRYRHYTGGTAFEKYTVDGRVLFRLPLPGSSQGCFTVSEGVVALPGQVLRQASGNVLRPEADVEGAYEHASAAWYPLQANR